MASSESTRRSLDIDKYVNAARWNKEGLFTFLLLAAVENRPDMVKLILDNTWGESDTQGGNIINQQSIGSKRTALHIAAERNYVRVVELLLDKGADVNAETTAGQTPLHLAAENNRQEAVLCLLNSQSSPQAKDHQGRTPLVLARRAGHEGIVKILERHEKKSCRRLCIEGSEECDQHCTSCLSFGIFHHFNLDVSCFKNPCSFVCKTLCCAWRCCCPLPIEEGAVPAPSSSSATTAPLLPGNAPMQRQ